MIFLPPQLSAVECFSVDSLLRTGGEATLRATVLIFL